MPVDNARTRDALLGFADAMDARDVADAAPAPGPELHLLTFAHQRHPKHCRPAGHRVRRTI